LHSIAREEKRASSDWIVYAMEAGTQRIDIRYRYQITAISDQEAKKKQIPHPLKARVRDDNAGRAGD